jgi:hypothetical protein
MDAMVRAVSHTHAQAADKVSAVAGETVTPESERAWFTGGFDAPDTGQNVESPVRMLGNQENIEPKKLPFVAPGTR